MEANHTIRIYSSLALLVGASFSIQTAQASAIQSIQDLDINCLTEAALIQKQGLNSLKMKRVGSHFSGSEFASSSAEIVSYDSCRDKLYVVNAKDQSIDVLRLSAEQSAPSKDGKINLQAAAQKAGIAIGDANSVVAKNGIVAVAIQNQNKQQNGIIALYRSDDLSLINTYPAGALPDMVTMTVDSRYLLSANEGEPNGDYSQDPEGSVTIVDLANGFGDQQAQIHQVRFSAFNQGQARHGELKDVRLPSPFGASVAQDLEPEYIALTEHGKALVALQENNAIAIIDIASAQIESIKGLGVKSWASVAAGGDGAKLDLSNKDQQFSQASYPQLVGYYMPDSIASFNIDGQDYLITANEGDGREYIYPTTQQQCEQAGHQWDGDDYKEGGKHQNAEQYQHHIDDCISYSDETRGYKLNVDPKHPLMDQARYGKKGTIANKKSIGRIKVVADNKNIGPNDLIYTFGARSFSIFDLAANRIFDSGNQLSDLANSPQHWNASNDNQSNDDRSDDKGVEPEAITVAKINGATIAFIGLERQGGVAAYDISKPAAPVLLDFVNNRDFNQPVCSQVDQDGDCANATYNPKAGDLGPESITYFSRIGQHYIAVGNEVSGTTTVYQLAID
ncbi:choice-of-anchor I family protein [Agarivorans sp. QJM3NY_25]|uniref:choice-of-anchor I family protein n=1 Tax=Agarivorans sp. QJM3NY_25 TaxID=3421430 RepID=UPI003D7D1A65